MKRRQAESTVVQRRWLAEPTRCKCRRAGSRGRGVDGNNRREAFERVRIIRRTHQDQPRERRRIRQRHRTCSPVRHTPARCVPRHMRFVSEIGASQGARLATPNAMRLTLYQRPKKTAGTPNVGRTSPVTTNAVCAPRTNTLGQPAHRFDQRALSCARTVGLLALASNNSLFAVLSVPDGRSVPPIGLTTAMITGLVILVVHGSRPLPASER